MTPQPLRLRFMIVYEPGPGQPKLIVLDHGEAVYYDNSGGSPERPLIEWAFQFLDKDKIFVDVGAHCGTWTLSYAPFVAGVAAFEAQRRQFYQLCGGIALNDLESKVIAHHLAVGDCDVPNVSLKITSEDGGMSSVMSLPFNDVPIAIEKVDMKPLDAMRLENVGLIKIDVEGAECKVLQGAVETLEKNGYPRMLIESWDPVSKGPWAERLRSELFAELDALKYDVISIRGQSEMILAEYRRR